MKPKTLQFLEVMEKKFGKKHVTVAEIEAALPASLKGIHIYSYLNNLSEKKKVLERSKNADGLLTHRLVANWREVFKEKRAAAPRKPRKARSKAGDLRLKDIEKLLEEHDLYADALRQIAAIVIGVVKK